MKTETAVCIQSEIATWNQHAADLKHDTTAGQQDNALVCVSTGKAQNRRHMSSASAVSSFLLAWV